MSRHTLGGRALGLLALILVALLLAACGGASPSPSAPGASPPSQSPSATPSPGASESSEPSPSASTAPGTPFDPAAVTVGLEKVLDGLTQPLAIVPLGDGSGRLLIAEQSGTLQLVDDGRLAPNPFLNISERITSGGERGLLGVAVHPDFPDDPRIFVNYTDRNGDTAVSSFTVGADGTSADPDSERILFNVEDFAPNHNGGSLAFGPDGFLYVATGDGGGGGDPRGSGQRLDTLLGKVLRIDVDREEGGRPYAVPADNPFVSTAGALPEIWLYGLRNPWRLSFDRTTGDLWIGDVGQGEFEEVDVARVGTGGLNFGWNRMEGDACFLPSDCDRSGLTLPVVSYSHDFGCVVVGGYVYRGAAQPDLAGGYIYADYCSGVLFALDPTSDGPQEPIVVGESGLSISSFGEDDGGELYVTDLSGGGLYRVVGDRR